MRKRSRILLMVFLLVLLTGCEKDFLPKPEDETTEGAFDPMITMPSTDPQSQDQQPKTYVISDGTQTELNQLLDTMTEPVYIQVEFDPVNTYTFCNEEYCSTADEAYEWLENRLDESRLVDTLDGELLLPAVVASGEKDGYTYQIHKNGKAQLVRYNGQETFLQIPDDIDGVPVAYIGDGLCGVDDVSSDLNDTIIHITLGKNVEYLDAEAFYGLAGLKTVQCNEGLLSIGYCAFGEDKALLSIDLPESLSDIGSYAFSGSGLTQIQLKNHVDIGEYAFFESELLSVAFPSEPIEIADSAFACTTLRELSVPSNILFEEDGEHGGIFRGNKKLKKVTFAPQMDKPIVIPAEMFAENHALQEVSLPNNVTKIGQWAFYACTSLRRLTIPASVTKIDQYAFRACYGLTDVYFESADCDMTGCGLEDHYVKIHAPAGGTVEKYCSQNLLNQFVGEG